MYSVSNLSKHYSTTKATQIILENVSFDVAEGESLTIVGPSGAGKTTLLRCMTGLLRPTTGTIAIDGRQLVGPQPDVAVVFQDYSRSLMPWLTVRKNVELPLRNKDYPRAKRKMVAETALAEVGLIDALDKYPGQLSGGMQQRVALARGLAFDPKILVMDEPFASVDAQTRGDLEDLVGRLQRVHNITMVVVTHDIDEAIYLSDRVVALGGKPTSVLEIVDVPLPWPRDQISTKSLADFTELRKRLMLLIRNDHGSRASQNSPGSGTIMENQR